MMLTRYRMRKCIRLLESGSDNTVMQLAKKSNYLKALHALEHEGCIKCFYADGCVIPLHIILESKSAVYQLHRFEIWLNRIASYFLGILSAVVAQIIANNVLPVLLEVLSKTQK